jgi:hypothetical protein
VTSLIGGDSGYWRIVLKKSFLGDERNFLEPLMRFARDDVRTFINGVLSGNILIDTSQVATDTIDYVATDTGGNTSTSTRTVIIDAATASTSTTP